MLSVIQKDWLRWCGDLESKDEADWVEHIVQL